MIKYKGDKKTEEHMPNIDTSEDLITLVLQVTEGPAPIERFGSALLVATTK
jgi:hypothetical protein